MNDSFLKMGRTRLRNTNIGQGLKWDQRYLPSLTDLRIAQGGWKNKQIPKWWFNGDLPW